MSTHLRFRHAPIVEFAWCPVCRARVTMPCVACRTRAAIATGLVKPRLDRRRDYVLQCELEPDEQANYAVFWQEYPHGMGPLARPVCLDNSAAVETLTEEEKWFVKTRKKWHEL